MHFRKINSTAGKEVVKRKVLEMEKPKGEVGKWHR